ncbi:hypothetical protein CkaCkLH20_09628 [Colletotrichum karsti]|uniref:ABC transporter n=1 Tax=Colletotrichum karsti TaxID=1095194 RepID=A0A9P6HZ10_9PEZI|nr:uncharacterized protein CkaCkLH20_09628 [Colletotrichum karsti]KAF9872765.1 hypothetical protein CkaCkLH20_09628 [Colletotrichum karsti]
MDQISFRIRAYLTYRIHAKSVEPMATQASARGSDSESAKVTVLASVDVTQAVFIPRVLAETTTSVIIVGVGAYLLYQAVDLVLIGPLLLALLSISIPISLGKRLTRSQRRALEATERRIRSVGQLVEKTRSIRMGGMESMAEKEVLENRVVEIKAMSLYRKLLIVVVFASDSVNGFSLLLTFGVYTAVNGTDLEYTTLFTALSVISIMLGPFPSFIQMLPALYEGFVSWGRISAYVKPDSEQSGDAHHLEKADNQICGLIHTSSDDLNVATFCGASLGWGTEKILFDVSLDLKKGSVIGVTGSSGCGKSTLLRSLIGEVNILSGTIRTSTLRTAFCDQTPYFLANRTIRQNIILESPFDGKLYSEVLHSCCLIPDISKWPKGDDTVLVDAVGTFTNDVNVLDLALPLAILNSIWAVAAVLGSMGVLAAGSVYTLISLAISLVVLYFIQRRYLATSSQLRTLQIASQAPVIGTLRASCDGRATIRAFNLQDSACSTLVDQVYQASKSAYLFKSLQAWLFLVIGLLAGGVAGTLAALLVGLKSTVNVGWAGVALVNTITLGSDLKMLMNWLTLLEAQLGVVRRIREFIATTPTEGDGHAGRVEEPPQGWPRKGNVVLHGVCAAYDDHPVLRNASVNIRAGEKVAVVGRTGSGKSSLIQLLFGLIEKTSGLVQVDDVDLDTVSVQSLRKSFAGVPQFTFCNSQASVKANIDPNDEHSHADVVEMIRLVSAGISEYGEPEAAIDIDQLWELSKFSSSGWQQRLGIARALLRSSALYVMDEPTSGMDGKNHKVMLSNMFQRRPESTFIIVTHHNDGLDIFDKVLTVQEGDILTSKS